jgi:hypothetical protein
MPSRKTRDDHRLQNPYIKKVMEFDDTTGVIEQDGPNSLVKRAVGTGAADSLVIYSDVNGVFVPIIDGVFGLDPLTVATLPAAPSAGARAIVTDSNADLATGIGNIVAGGGANVVPVYYDGAAWRIG